MNTLELSDKFAQMWRKSREDAGKSQAYMAKALGVSRTTVQHWEDGTASPSQMKGFQWFDALGLQPLPYYLSLIYDTDINAGEIDSLTEIVSDLPTDQQKKILYLISGSHGSSVAGVIELITAYLLLPLRDRLAIAQSIATMYRVVLAEGSARADESIRPDMKILTQAINRGTMAVLSGRRDYSQLIGDDLE